MKKILAACLFFATSVSLAHAADVARFDGGIGVQPLRPGVAAGTSQPNEVITTAPAGRPWVIERLTARVRVDGRISVDGRGLVLAGGNNIGTSGGQSVRAQLYCGGLSHVTANPVALEPNGDFRIDDQLTPAVPNPCANPILLIISNGGNWFAAGIPKQ
jgi:hypothetical protein